MISQNIKTDRSICVDVRVIDLGREADLGGFERVVGGEHNREKEDATGVWGIALNI